MRRTEAHLVVLLPDTEAPRLMADRERDRERPLPAESVRAKRRMARSGRAALCVAIS